MLFALDSIPAVFAVTDEAFIVFAANAFALLGLRALFFLVTGLLDRLVYLWTGLAFILAFIGVKLVLHWAHEAVSTDVPGDLDVVSLIVIASCCGHDGREPDQDAGSPGAEGARRRLRARTPSEELASASGSRTASPPGATLA